MKHRWTYRRHWTDAEYQSRLDSLCHVYQPAVAAVLAESDSLLCDLQPVVWPLGYRYRDPGESARRP